jgi:hypothetical protein
LRNYFDNVPDMEIDKPIDQLLEKNADTNSPEVMTEDWSPSTAILVCGSERGSRTPFSALMSNQSMGERLLLGKAFN